jgi:hypothetical protein
MLDAIGGGLIGVGAFLLLTTLWWPSPPREMVGMAEHGRTSRNSDVSTIVSAASTFAGAVLLLVRSEWLWAFLGVGLGAALYYGMLAAWTRSEWAAIRRQVVRERENGDGRITVDTANRIGLRKDAYGESSMASHLMNNAEFGAHAQRIAERNSRWSWALRHPRGGGWDRLSI